MDISLERASHLPFLPYLFDLCLSGHCKIRRVERLQNGHQTSDEMPPLSPRRIRPGTVTTRCLLLIVREESAFGNYNPGRHQFLDTQALRVFAQLDIQRTVLSNQPDHYQSVSGHHHYLIYFYCARSDDASDAEAAAFFPPDGKIAA